MWNCELMLNLDQLPLLRQGIKSYKGREVGSRHMISTFLELDDGSTSPVAREKMVHAVE